MNSFIHYFVFLLFFYIHYTISFTVVPSVSSYANVSYLTPSPNQTDFIDGMPTGNGRVASIVWGNASHGGFDFYVNSPLAMATDSTLLSIARISVRLSPNPWSTVL